MIGALVAKTRSPRLDPAATLLTHSYLVQPLLGRELLMFGVSSLPCIKLYSVSSCTVGRQRDICVVANSAHC